MDIIIADLRQVRNIKFNKKIRVIQEQDNIVDCMGRYWSEGSKSKYEIVPYNTRYGTPIPDAPFPSFSDSYDKTEIPAGSYIFEDSLFMGKHFFKIRIRKDDTVILDRFSEISKY